MDENKTDAQRLREKAERIQKAGEKMQAAGKGMSSFGTSWMKFIFYLALLLIIVFITKACVS